MYLQTAQLDEGNWMFFSGFEFTVEWNWGYQAHAIKDDMKEKNAIE